MATHLRSASWTAVPLKTLELTAPATRLSGLQDLVQSLSAVGQQEPIYIRRDGEHVIVVSGNRRVRAAQLLGWSSLDAIELRPDRDGTHVN